MKRFSNKSKQTEEFHAETTATHTTELQYCLRCGRKLKSSEAKERGMGKICYEKSKHSRQTTLF